MVDTGLIDPLKLVGFELEAGAYDSLKKAGRLSHSRLRRHRTSSGKIVTSETGLATAQLLEPVSHLAIGPLISVYMSRGAAGLPSRAGLVFFHQLHGCRVDWDLTARTWSIEVP